MPKVASREQRDAIAEFLGDFRFAAGFGRTLSRLVRHGIGVHHAGMLPSYRRLVERLAQAGLLKVICGTDTLGVGINVPIRTVVLTALSKYDGERTRQLKAREFHQIAGRAGRAGYDTAGLVVVQAPDHVIENEKALAKAGDDPKKRRKVVRKKPPQGFVSWGKPTYERLVAAEPEPLTSSFAVTSAMLLNLAARPGDATRARPAAAGRHPRERRGEGGAPRARRGAVGGAAGRRRRRAAREPDAEGHVVRVTADLQPDFALNQPLSPFALAAFELLDPASPTYALDVIRSWRPPSRTRARCSTPSATGPRRSRRADEGRRHRVRRADGAARGRDLPEAAGRELLEGAYALYAEGHPWVTDDELKPKSVVREMVEQAMTFTDYISLYQLARSEGLLLRYLSDAYRALRQTVPEDARTEELAEIIEWLGEIVRQVDSSLLDEWEALTSPAAAGGRQPSDAAPPPVTANRRAFRVLVRNAMFRRVRLLARRDWAALAAVDGLTGAEGEAVPGVSLDSSAAASSLRRAAWSLEDWAAAGEDYAAEHDEVGLGPDARGPSLFVLRTDPADLVVDGLEVPDDGHRRWGLEQVVDDPDGVHDWRVVALVDLDATDEAGEPVISGTRLHRL